VAGHDVGIDVDGVDGVGDGDRVVRAEDVEDVAGVALEPSEMKISSAEISQPRDWKSFWAMASRRKS